jgi:hypothetical protein
VADHRNADVGPALPEARLAAKTPSVTLRGSLGIGANPQSKPVSDVRDCARRLSAIAGLGAVKTGATWRDAANNPTPDAGVDVVELTLDQAVRVLELLERFRELRFEVGS